VGLERLPDPRGVQSDRPTRLGTDGVAPELGTGEFDAEVARLAVLRVAAEESARGMMLTPEQRAKATVALREDPLLREAARVRVEASAAERARMLSELF
jgi:hypothetical protein